MPLVKNIPHPKDERWRKVRCPVCGAECWKTPAVIWNEKSNLVKIAACTECALTETMRKIK